MAFTQWPFDFEPDGVTQQQTTEDEFRHTLAAAAPDGVIRTPGGPADPMPVAPTPDGASIRIGPGYAQVAGYTAHNDADVDIVAPANVDSLPRQYWLVLRLDRTLRTITPQVLSGTPATIPQLPALTRTADVYEMPLARWRRNPGGGIQDFTDRRMIITPDGSLVGRSDNRPYAPVPGTRLYEADTGREMYFHGDVWRPVVDPSLPTGWTNIPLASGITAYANRPGGLGYAPRYRLIGNGNRVRLRGMIARSNGGDFTDLFYTVATMPAGFRPNEATYHVAAATQSSARYTHTCRWEIHRNGTLRVYLIDGHNPSWLSIDGFEYDLS